MPEWGWLIAAASVVLTAAGFIGSTWGRVIGLRSDLEDWRKRDSDHLADLAESRAELAEERTQSAEKDARIAALVVALTGKVEWAQVVATQAKHRRDEEDEHNEILAVLRAMKALLDKEAEQ